MPINKTTRTAVTCPSCDYMACKECTRTYLKTLPKLPQCMNCGDQYTHAFLIQAVNRSWVNKDFQGPMENILFGIELGKLPATQPYVELELERTRLVDQSAQFLAQIKVHEKSIFQLSKAIEANKFLMRGEIVPHELRNGYVNGRPLVVDNSKTCVLSCPLDCRGFLTEEYKCGTCQSTICKDCLTVNDEEHVCDENTRLSAEMIKRESRPCPRCRTRICKIDGCDQMYCIAKVDGRYCDTAFSWITGCIDTGTVHNPHFFELQQQTGVHMRRAVGDIHCGGVPDIFNLVRYLLSNMTPDIEAVRHKIVRLHRAIGNIVNYNIREYRERLNYHPVILRHQRVLFMLKRISKEMFKKKIYESVTTYNKERSILQLIELVGVCGIEMFICITTPEENDFVTTMKYINERIDYLNDVRLYFNEQMKSVSIQYNCSVDLLGETFKWRSTKFNLNGTEIKKKSLL